MEEEAEDVAVADAIASELPADSQIRVSLRDR